jgi:hypothetical protein
VVLAFCRKFAVVGDQLGIAVESCPRLRYEVGQILVREGLALPCKDGPEAKAKRLKQWCG